MKKLLPIIALVLVLGAAGAYFMSKKDTKTPTTSSTPATTQPASTNKTFTTKKACDVLTLDDAKQVLGATAKQGSESPQTSSSDLDVSVCSYSDGSSSLGDSKSATLLVRSPKTDNGIKSNESAFGANKPAEAQDVSGYGDKAFWNPQFGQLNVLKGNTWYIISNGPLKAADKTLDQAKKLADIIVGKL